MEKGSETVIEALGRGLGLALIGGGSGFLIGELHRIAAHLDGRLSLRALLKQARQSGGVLK
jgi:hypothetical protein